VAEAAFRRTLDWLREHFGEFRFFVERDLVWTLQQRLETELGAAGTRLRVFNDFPVQRGKRGPRRGICADLAVVDAAGNALLAAEVKFEPAHARGKPGGDNNAVERALRLVAVGRNHADITVMWTAA